MEIVMKTGKELNCPYTGSKTDVLVTLKTDDGAVSSSSLSEDALVQGLNFIRAYKQSMGIPLNAVQTIAPAVIQQRAVVTPVIPGRQLLTEVPDNTAPIMSGAPVDPLPLIEQFAKAVVALVENPPEDQAGKQQGLAEIHIRDLIGKWKTSFRDPMNAMFPILNQAIGMSRERVELLLA